MCACVRARARAHTHTHTHTKQIIKTALSEEIMNYKILDHSQDMMEIPGKRPVKTTVSERDTQIVNSQ